MKQVIAEEGSRPIKIWTNEVEGTALAQLKNIAKLPFIHPNGVAAMPDVHAGIGATIGSVIATEKAIIPAAVGVDIGCGMNAVRLTLKASDLPDSLAEIRTAIEAAIPVGSNKSGSRREDQITPSLVKEMHKLADKSPASHQTQEFVLGPDFWKKCITQLGTLGSGNHFIEICIDQDQHVWVMLHSGSRGIGNAIGRHYIDRAKHNMEKYFISLPDAALAYLPDGTEDFEDYVEAVQWAQDYALANRKLMMEEVLLVLKEKIPVEFSILDEGVNCHHNYVERENHFGRNVWVTRKGAIRAREGELGIIPGSMGQRSYIVRGKGNLQSYCSCSHGAGRSMSRTEARKRFTVDDLKVQTQGVECRKDDAVLDEIPSAYKDIDQVMDNQKDLVEVVHTLKQVLCVKGS